MKIGSENVHFEEISIQRNTNTASQNTLAQSPKPDFSNDSLSFSNKTKLNSTLETKTYDEGSFFFLIHFKQL